MLALLKNARVSRSCYGKHSKSMFTCSR